MRQYLLEVRIQFEYFLLLPFQYCPVLSALPVCLTIADIPGNGRPQKVTWAPVLKGQPHAPLQIFHLIKYASIVSHTCEAALT